MTQPTCYQRLEGAIKSRLGDLKAFMEADDLENVEDLGSFYDYALCFDYVAPYTFRDQPRGYWRYQISYGGPSEEIRFYGACIDDYHCILDRADFWFLDWGDGACRSVIREACVRWLWDQMVKLGSAAHAYHEAMKDYEPMHHEEEDDDE